MKIKFLSPLLLLALALNLSAQDKAAPKPATQAPDVAAPKNGRDGMPDLNFIKRHESYVQIAKAGGVDLAFFGDSITDGWHGKKEIWDAAFGKYKPANFGIGGDRTQHVIWRIENGEMEGISPKAAVVMIGTNNSGGDDAPGIARGVTAVVKAIHAKSPKTKVLLLAVFPRGPMPNPTREKLKAVNDTIAKLDDGKTVFYLDIGAKFLEADGTLTKEIMPDFLHLSSKGYQIWADATSAKLAELMK